MLAIAPPPPEGAASSQRTQLQNKLYTGDENRTAAEIELFNGKTLEGRVADLLPYVRLNGLEVTAGSLLLEGTGRTAIDPGLLITNPAVTTGGTVTLN